MESVLCTVGYFSHMFLAIHLVSQHRLVAVHCVGRTALQDRVHLHSGAGNDYFSILAVINKLWNRSAIVLHLWKQCSKLFHSVFSLIDLHCLVYLILTWFLLEGFMCVCVRLLVYVRPRACMCVCAYLLCVYARTCMCVCL